MTHIVAEQTDRCIVPCAVFLIKMNSIVGLVFLLLLQQYQALNQQLFCSTKRNLHVAARHGTMLGAKRAASGGTVPAGKKTSTTSFIRIEDVHTDLYKLESIVDVLRAGGVGVIPTDTCYSFVTSLSSREGLERLMRLKGISGQKKPLSLLCKDVSTIAKYTTSLTDQKWVFKLLKTSLPGPFTFILPASKEVPKLILEHEKHIKRWKRKEIGVRLPDDAICEYILGATDEPLLCGSVPEALEDEVGLLSLSAQRALHGENTDTDNMEEEKEEEEEEEDHSSFDANYYFELGSCNWYPQVDFVVENGPRGVIIDDVSDEQVTHKKGKKPMRASASSALSTVVDLTRDPPVLLRQGKGMVDVDNIVTTA